MPKTIKEVYSDYTGVTTIEYSDDTTRTYTVDEVATVKSNPLTGGLVLSAGGVTLETGPSATPFNLNAPFNGIGETVLFDVSASASASGTGTQAITDGSAACPDPTFPMNVFQIGPAGIIDQALAATVPLAGIDSIGFWARATRVSDSEKFSAVKLMLSDTTAGFTNFGTLTCAIRADGVWRYHVAPIQGFAVGTTPWATVVGRLRLREDDAVTATGRPLMGTGDRIQIGAVRVNPRGKTSMFVRFDDGLDNLYSQRKAVVASNYLGSSGAAIPAGTYTFMELLDFFGFKGNCFVLTDFIGRPGFETWDGLRALQKKGWSICVQAGANPVSNNADGARLFGPLGYNLHPTPGDVASVTNSIFTLSGSRPDSIGGTAGSVALGGVQPFPVQVLGTVPAPLVSGETYYALRRGVRTFSLHTVPVGLSPQDDNAGLVTITGTVTTGMTLRYAGSTNDESGIIADYQKAQNALAANGLTGGKHLALNQGGYDYYVEKAIVSLGFKSVQTTSMRPDFVSTVAGAVAVSIPNISITPLTNGRAGTTISGAFSVLTINQTDGALTPVQLRQFVSNCVKFGSVGANYHHNTNNIPELLAYLDQCKVYANAGLLDVLTVEEQQRRIDGAVRNPVL